MFGKIKSVVITRVDILAYIITLIAITKTLRQNAKMFLRYIVVWKVKIYLNMK